MTPAIATRNAPSSWGTALIIAAFAVSAGSSAQTQPAPPTATECSALIRMAQDDTQRRRMTKEQLERTSFCLSLMKQTRPAISSAPIKIFRN